MKNKAEAWQARSGGSQPYPFDFFNTTTSALTGPSTEELPPRSEDLLNEVLKAIAEVEEADKPSPDLPKIPGLLGVPPALIQGILNGVRLVEAGSYVTVTRHLKFKRHRGRHKRQKVLVCREGRDCLVPEGEVWKMGSIHICNPKDYKRLSDEIQKWPTFEKAISGAGVAMGPFSRPFGGLRIG